MLSPLVMGSWSELHDIIISLKCKSAMKKKKKGSKRKKSNSPHRKRKGKEKNFILLSSLLAPRQ